MNSRLRMKAGAGAMILLLAVIFAPTIAGAFGPGEGGPKKGFAAKGKSRPALGLWRNPGLVQELGLTAEQVKQVREADFAFREKHLGLKAQLESLKLQMDRAISQEIDNDAAVLSLAEKISQVKGRMFFQKVESRLALRKILTPDQIEKLKIRAMKKNKHGRKVGRERMAGRRSLERSDAGTLSGTSTR